MNVARASLQELLIDYEDFLRANGLEQWTIDSPKAIKAREVCSKHQEREIPEMIFWRVLGFGLLG